MTYCAIHGSLPECGDECEQPTGASDERYPPFSDDEWSERGGTTTRVDRIYVRGHSRNPSRHHNLDDTAVDSPFVGGVEASHDDAHKPRLDLLPFRPLEKVSDVLAYGATKYGVNNWERGSHYRRYLASALRHLVAFIRGEDIDPESGCHHLAHCVANCLFIIQWQQEKIGVDDRCPSTNTSAANAATRLKYS